MKDNNEIKFFRDIIVQFPVRGQNLPADHGYLLYAAISQLKPELHETGWLGVEMISGTPYDKGLIALPNFICGFPPTNSAKSYRLRENVLKLADTRFVWEFRRRARFFHRQNFTRGLSPSEDLWKFPNFWKRRIASLREWI